MKRFDLILSPLADHPRSLFDLERLILSNPSGVLIAIAGNCPLSPSIALAYYNLLNWAASKTTIVTSAYTSLQGAEAALLWCSGTHRLIQPFATVFVPKPEEEFITDSNILTVEDRHFHEANDQKKVFELLKDYIEPEGFGRVLEPSHLEDLGLVSSEIDNLLTHYLNPKIELKEVNNEFSNRRKP